MKIPFHITVVGLAALASATPIDAAVHFFSKVVNHRTPNTTENYPNTNLEEWITVSIDRVNRTHMHTRRIPWNPFGSCQQFSDDSQSNLNKSVVWTICNDQARSKSSQPIQIEESNKHLMPTTYLIPVHKQECRAKMFPAEKNSDLKLQICNNLRHFTYLHFENKNILSSVIPIEEMFRISPAIAQKFEDKFAARRAEERKYRNNEAEVP